MRAYWSLRILTVLFLTPFLAALYLLIHGDYQQFKTVQHGTLIQPARSLNFESLYALKGIKLSSILTTNKWHVIYLSPANCDQACQAQKQILTNLHAALGANRERVIMASTDNIPNYSLKDGSILIIDPLGFYIMHYDPQSKPKDLLKDLKRLLKYSHAK